MLDLLPLAVSSVYFVWNPDWSGMSLGKVSALREIGMVREFEQSGVWEKGKGRYMMGEWGTTPLPSLSTFNDETDEETFVRDLVGYYIEVPKMRYKADYQPSFLLDPVSFSLYLLSLYSPRGPYSERMIPL